MYEDEVGGSGGLATAATATAAGRPASVAAKVFDWWGRRAPLAADSSKAGKHGRRLPGRARRRMSASRRAATGGRVGGRRRRWDLSGGQSGRSRRRPGRG